MACFGANSGFNIGLPTVHLGKLSDSRRVPTVYNHFLNYASVFYSHRANLDGCRRGVWADGANGLWGGRIPHKIVKSSLKMKKIKKFDNKFEVL